MNILHLQLSGGPGGIVSLCRDINKHSAHHNFFYFLFEGGSIADEIAAQGGTVQVATGAKNHPLKAATDHTAAVIPQAQAPVRVWVVNGV